MICTAAWNRVRKACFLNRLLEAIRVVVLSQSILNINVNFQSVNQLTPYLLRE